MKFSKTALLLGIGTCMALTACDNSKTNTSTDNTQTSTTTAKDNQTPATKATNSITINNASEPESLDPHIAQGVQEWNIIRQMLEGLVSFDNEGKLKAGIATEWSSPDNKVWTFKLRDAKWSNGDPVTAHDFVYSFQRLVTPATGSYYASYLADAKVVNAQDIIDGKAAPDTLGAKAIDDKTLEITLSEPVPYFVDMLFHNAMMPVHKATVEAHKEKWTDPANIVVNGAYKPKEWIVNEKIVLARNDSYHDNANTKLDELVVLPITSATTDIQRYQAGEVDVTANEIPSEQFASLKASLGDELKTAPSLCTYYYDLNHSKAPFDNEKVRRALSLAFDRETIADKIMGQGQVVAYQFTPVSIKGGLSYTPEWQAWDRAKRLEEAKKLLAEAGYSKDKPLKFSLLYDTNEMHKKIAVAASSIWKESLEFVEIELVNQEWKAYLDSRRNGNYEMTRARWCGDYNDASTFLNLKKSNNTNNWTRFKNAEYDALMDKTLVAGLSDADRVALYKEAEGILDKHSVHVDVFYYANVRLVKPYVDGYSNKDPLDFWQAKYWSVKK